MEKIAIYPGSFDPFTLGHKIIVDQALTIFDTVYVAIGVNTHKQPFFSTEKRIKLIQKCFIDNPRVKIVSYSGLTADFCRHHHITFIVRGVRNVVDFEFERSIASANKRLNHSLDSVFLMTPAEYSDISSTTVREIIQNGGDPMAFMPKEICWDDLQ